MYESSSSIYSKIYYFELILQIPISVLNTALNRFRFNKSDSYYVHVTRLLITCMSHNKVDKPTNNPKKSTNDSSLSS